MFRHRESGQLRLFVSMAVTVLLASLLGACNLQAPSCELDAMPAPLLILPNNFVDTNPPEFQWRYFGSCLPDDFRIIISHTPAMTYGFTEYAATIVQDLRVAVPVGPAIIYEDGSMSHGYKWTPSEPLADGIYYWRVAPYSGDFHGEYSDWGGFKIGHHCASIADYPIAPRLLYPYYAYTLYANRPHFIWVDDNACRLPGYYIVEVSEFTTFSDTRRSHVWQMPDYYWGSWPGDDGGSLQYCTRYYWRVRTQFVTGEEGPTSDIFYFDISNVGGTACESGGAPTPTPDVARPMARVIQDAVCWSGPSMEYSIVDFLTPNLRLDIQGRDQYSTWWYVLDPNLQARCWVFGERVEPIGDLSQVPLVQAAPPPTATPSPIPLSCRDYISQGSCQNAGCTWDPNFQPNGICK